MIQTVLKLLLQVSMLGNKNGVWCLISAVPNWDSESRGLKLNFRWEYAAGRAALTIQNEPHQRTPKGKNGERFKEAATQRYDIGTCHIVPLCSGMSVVHPGCALYVGISGWPWWIQTLQRSWSAMAAMTAMAAMVWSLLPRLSAPWPCVCVPHLVAAAPSKDASDRLGRRPLYKDTSSSLRA